jgi:hypothetical protein
MRLALEFVNYLQGLDINKRLTAFHYKSCGGLIDVRSLSLMPDPLQFPGTITFSASAALNTTLSAPLNVSYRSMEQLVWDIF